MAIFTNTNHVAVLLLALLSFTSFSLSNETPIEDNGGNGWTILEKREGIIISYDIQDCLKEHLLLTLRVLNDTDTAKKIRFRVDVHNEDGTRESYNFIKAIAAYTTEKADCSEQSRMTGLVRMLKNASEDSKVTIHFSGDEETATN
ncbi:MAG: hypothetical protein IPN76_23980 [Saprospiraceae bacterium]|nr:hypothetical protein [Saprospiraceae bacterium]